jgi:hypothetical protein
MHSLIAPQAPSGYNRNFSTVKIISAVLSRNNFVDVLIPFIGARVLGKQSKHADVFPFSPSFLRLPAHESTAGNEDT